MLVAVLNPLPYNDSSTIYYNTNSGSFYTPNHWSGDMTIISNKNSIVDKMANYKKTENFNDEVAKSLGV